MQVQSVLLHDNVLNFTQQHSAVVTVQGLQNVVSSVTVLVSCQVAEEMRAKEELQSLAAMEVC